MHLFATMRPEAILQGGKNAAFNRLATEAPEEVAIGS
jgi:hypothetical protein